MLFGIVFVFCIWGWGVCHFKWFDETNAISNSFVQVAVDQYIVFVCVEFGRTTYFV